MTTTTDPQLPYPKSDAETEAKAAEAKAGYIREYISGYQVKATPEEVEAVQVFAKRLVEDYGYKKSQIQTRPQFRVRKNPSDEDKGYPVDIAVFHDDTKTEDNVFLIVECKKRTRKDGVAQLKLYLDMSRAEIGVWFNGEDHLYLRKIYQQAGGITYKEMSAIPRQGQRLEDIGLFARKDLRPPSNLKAVFRDIRNHLAGNTTGMTRDEAFASEIINILFCKIYDELNTGQDETVTFRTGIDEDPQEVKRRLVDLFENKVKAEYADVFAERDTINLDADSLVYVVGELQNYSVVEADRDAVGDAFEVFIGPALRGGEGQFFTPRNVVKMVIDILDPQPGDMIMDPACGSGGFLIMALEHVWRHLEAEAGKMGWSAVQLDRKKRDIASKCFRGLDKDSFLAKVTKAYMAIIGDGRGGVFCENSLQPPADWSNAAQDKIKLGKFDIILTNPPFGAKIPIKGTATLAQYELGHKWAKDKVTGEMQKTAAMHEDQPPQVLFLERCLQLLKPGGRLGIVLPEGAVSNPSYRHLITFVLQKTKMNGIVAMPEALFKTSGKGGTHTKVCVLFLEKGSQAEPYKVFMSDVKWCGHDSRGNPTVRKAASGETVVLDDVPLVAERFHALVSGATAEQQRSNSGATAEQQRSNSGATAEQQRSNSGATAEQQRSNSGAIQDRLGFLLASDKIINKVFVPKYYDPDLDHYLAGLSDTHSLVTVRELVEQKALSITTGAEVGKMAYGTGRIPFVRTSDISNWEIKADFKHGVSEEIYTSEKGKSDVQAGDILMVRDGTYLIGTTAIVTESDLPMLFQSHLYRLRVTDANTINPWLLFACLNTAVVKRQIKAKQFTQDIIDTLGNRVMELMLPVPKDPDTQNRLAEETKKTVETRVALRNYAKQIALEVEGIQAPSEEDAEVLEEI